MRLSDVFRINLFFKGWLILLPLVNNEVKVRSSVQQSVTCRWGNLIDVTYSAWHEYFLIFLSRVCTLGMVWVIGIFIPALMFSIVLTNVYSARWYAKQNSNAKYQRNKESGRFHFFNVYKLLSIKRKNADQDQCFLHVYEFLFVLYGQIFKGFAKLFQITAKFHFENFPVVFSGCFVII